MKRIMIIGCGGAGKSTLAQQLHAITGIPLIHLDRHYYQPDWAAPKMKEWEATVATLAARDKWIMDGNYGGTMDLRFERADTIIFLDRSRWRCLYRVIKRLVASYGRTRPDMGAGCRERFNWGFIVYVFRYNSTRRPALLNRLADLADYKEVYRLRNDKGVNAFLRGLAMRGDGAY
ncbi:MAG: hypothetical protein WA952_19090 [Lewinella sp.]